MGEAGVQQWSNEAVRIPINMILVSSLDVQSAASQDMAAGLQRSNCTCMMQVVFPKELVEVMNAYLTLGILDCRS